MHSEPYTEEPSSWPYFFTYPFIVSFILTLIIPTFISPWLGRTFLPQKYPKLGKKLSLFHSLPASTLHAVFCTGMVVYLLWSGSMGTNRVFSKSPLGFATMQITLGYLVADFLICLSDRHLRADRFMLMHHAFGIIGISLGLYCQGKFMYFIVSRQISEFSTPTVNLFVLLLMLDKRDSSLFVFNSLAMIFAFFLCRLLLLPWFWIEMVQTLSKPASTLVPLHLRVWTLVTYVIFDTLNLWWFWKMLKGALKFFTKAKLDKDLL